MRALADRHPNLVTWLVLSIGMVVVLFWSARDVALTALQFFWLGVATVLLAGLCAWIISWEADEPDDESEAPPPESSTAGAGSPPSASEAPGPEPADSPQAEPPGPEPADSPQAEPPGE